MSFFLGLLFRHPPVSPTEMGNVAVVLIVTAMFLVGSMKLLSSLLNEREIFLTAAKWVPETDRFCFAIENQAGKQTSLPVLLHVRKPGSKIAAK